MYEAFDTKTGKIVRIKYNLSGAYNEERVLLERHTTGENDVSWVPVRPYNKEFEKEGAFHYMKGDQKVPLAGTTEQLREYVQFLLSEHKDSLRFTLMCPAEIDLDSYKKYIYKDYQEYLQDGDDTIEAHKKAIVFVPKHARDTTAGGMPDNDVWMDAIEKLPFVIDVNTTKSQKK